LSAQVSVDRDVRLRAWIAFLRAHAAVTRRLNADLVATHGLTINDYEVLLHLSFADGHRLRRVDLAERVLLTASGITRLLEGLDEAGFVCRARCDVDGRVSYAVLTDAGRRKLEEARDTHLAGIRDVFAGSLGASELETLASLLERLPAAGSDCGPQEA
jgi:DNA-binding MarR family transcriptional regulator